MFKGSTISRRTRKLMRGNRYFANDLSFLNPELLSREAILALQPRLVVSRLVARNFDVTPGNFGDVIQIPRPGSFAMTRKDGICDAVVTQDITGDRIQAQLDQWPQVAFKICDGESRDVPTLIQQELVPAVQALGTGLDYIVSGQIQRFYAGGVAGHLGGMSPTTVNDYILDGREVMNEANVPDDNRILLMTGPTETAGLKNELFVRADQSGSTDALRRASLGQLYNFDIFNPSNQPNVRTGQPTITAAINVSGGLAAGSTALTFDAPSATIPAGTWAVIAGDDTPQHITATNGTTTATIFPGLRRAVADNAVITIIAGGAVNLVAGYRGRNTTTGVPGWAKEITVSGFTVAPRIGQGVTFGTQTEVYTVIGVNGTIGITLDRPLEFAVANSTSVNLMPAGQFNMAFRPNAFALIVRPLAAPVGGAGAIARTINYNGLSIRVTISYDGSIQAHRVVLDFLAGINILDANQVAPIYG